MGVSRAASPGAVKQAAPQSEVKENAAVKNSTPLDTNAKTVQKEAEAVKTVQEDTDAATKTAWKSKVVVMMFLVTLVTVLGCLFFFFGHHLDREQFAMAGCSSVVIFLGVALLARRALKGQCVKASKKE